MNRPNIFDYATSELSQDAIIAWMLAWGNPKFQDLDRDLHLLSHEMLRAFFELHETPFPKKIETIDVLRQHRNIDVLCIVNDEIAIIIEDKTVTREHSGQLKRYLEETKGKDFDKILGIYFKTHEQSSLENVKNDGFQPFLRDSLLPILENCDSDNDVFLDFRRKVKAIESDYESYLTLPPNEWHGHSWAGFYQRLQRELGLEGMHWKYVPNPSGGFLGFFWGWVEDSEYGCGAYLQIEQGKFCFKLGEVPKDVRSPARWKWHDRLVGPCPEHGVSIVKPARFGSGSYMTVAMIDGNFIRTTCEGLIDFAATVALIKDMEKLLNSASRP